MRLTLAGIPAALITLMLFVLMQAMVASPERIPTHSAARNPVAFVSPFALARGTSDGAPAAEPLPTPTAMPSPPPLPDFTPPQVAERVPAPPNLPVTAARPPEFPLDLGRLELPQQPPAQTPPARRAATQRVARPPEPAVRRPSPERSAAPAASAEREIAQLTAPAEPFGRAGAERADPGGDRGRAQAGDMPIEAIPVVRVEPEYPRKAARAGREGWVKLAFVITPSGGVADVRIVESSPRRVFDRAAKRALEQWRFRPQRIDGRSMARQAVQVIEFKLADRG